MSNEELGYGTAAGKYWTASWRGVLPLPHGEKFPPPKGWTGYDAPYASWPDIQAWTEDHPDGNLGLRLPNTVIGLDCDHYGDKRGGDTLTHAESLWGELPPTVRSTSRLDGISGIRLYRVPAGTQLETIIQFPELRLGHVEVIQASHRYAVAWPSLHGGTGRRYRWLGPDGNVTADIPRPINLPDLPTTWLEGLRRKHHAEVTAHGDADKVLQSLPAGPASPHVQQVLAKALTGLNGGSGSRHDTTRDAVLALFRLAERGESGVREALERLEAAFIAAITLDGSRTTDQAQVEWDRMVRGQRGHDLIASTPSVPTLADLLGKQPVVATVQSAMPFTRAEQDTGVNTGPSPSSAPPSEFSADALRDDLNELLGDGPPVVQGSTTQVGFEVYEQLDDFDALLMGGSGYSSLAIVPIVYTGEGLAHERRYVPDPFDELLMAEEQGTTVEARTSWGPVDLEAILSGDLSPEEPTVLCRADGKYLLYPGRVNALIGPPESAKSWLAQLACVQEMKRGNSVAYIDFEDTPQGICARLLALDVPAQTIIRGLYYTGPDTPMGLEERDELFSTLDRTNPTIIVVDGVNAAMTLLGLDLERNTDATQFHQLILKPLAMTGAAVITVDHVTKAKETRGNYAIGAQAKRAMTDGAMIGVECTEQFGRGRLGKLELSVLKDKPGGVRAIAEKRGKNTDYLASVIVDARIEGRVEMHMVWEEQSDSDGNGDNPLERKLVVKMTEVSQWMTTLDRDKKGMSLDAIIQNVPGYPKDIRAAVNTLARMKYVRIEGSKHVLERPYLGVRNEQVDELNS